MVRGVAKMGRPTRDIAYDIGLRLRVVCMCVCVGMCIYLYMCVYIHISFSAQSIYLYMFTTHRSLGSVCVCRVRLCTYICVYAIYIHTTYVHAVQEKEKGRGGEAFARVGVGTQGS